MGNPSTKVSVQQLLQLAARLSNTERARLIVQLQAITDKPENFEDLFNALKLNGMLVGWNHLHEVDKGRARRVCSRMLDFFNPSMTRRQCETVLCALVRQARVGISARGKTQTVGAVIELLENEDWNA